MNKSDARPLWTIPAQVRKARELVGLSLNNAAVRIGVPVQLLSAWEAGMVDPSMQELRQLSEVYERPMRFFFVSEAVVSPTQYRRLPAEQRAELSYETRRTWAKFEKWCRLSWELEVILELPLEARINIAQSSDDPEGVAVRGREWLGEFGLRLKAPPPSEAGYRLVFNEYRRSIENLGVKVFALELPVSEMRGASWWHQEYGPAILLNQNDWTAPKLFTLLHEYSHLLLHRSGSASICDLEGEADEELFANQFSAAVLVSRQSFLSVLERRGILARRDWDDKLLESLARTFKVSKHVIAIRLENMGLARRGFYREKRDIWDREPPKKKDFPPHGKGRRPAWQIHIEDELGPRYERLVWDAFGKRLLTKADLMRFLNLRLEEVDNWLNMKATSA